MSSSTLIVNARLVNEGTIHQGDLRIENGRIAQIGAGLEARPGETVVDAAGRWLLPGMIDDQVHFREPGMPHKGDMATDRGHNAPQLRTEARHGRFAAADSGFVNHSTFNKAGSGATLAGGHACEQGQMGTWRL